MKDKLRNEIERTTGFLVFSPAFQGMKVGDLREYLTPINERMMELFEESIREIIGDDEHVAYPPGQTTRDWDQDARNKLRTEQRKRAGL